jgi:phytoene desaturase
MKIAIIGAGIAGLATAVRLQKQGHSVTVFEASEKAGGKLSEAFLEGCRFDLGPSLFTLPELVEDLFVMAEEPIANYFNYKQLEVLTNYFYDDGTTIQAYSNPEKFANEIAQKTTEKAETVLKFLKQSSEKYELSSDIFLKQSLHKFTNFLNLKTLVCMLNMRKLDVFRTMAQANQKTFSDTKVQQLFNRYATYNGSNPYQTPATLNIIPHLEYNIGAYIPVGGMYDITKAVFKLAQKLGVVFRFDTQVEKITTEKKGKITKSTKITGLEIAGKHEDFDIVVSNADVVNTYRKLLPEVLQPEKILNQPKSSSALIFYWAVNQEFKQLDLHNILFSKDYEKEFEHIFVHKNISDDPTIYINITSKQVPTDAPAGMENWFTMINVPNNSGQDWDTLIAKARKDIIAKLNKILKTDIEPKIIGEMILDPRTIESRTSSSQGALYGNSSNNRYAAFLRHANFSSKIKGLYFCGGSVHPGGGIPLSLLSAKIVGDLIR